MGKFADALGKFAEACQQMNTGTNSSSNSSGYEWKGILGGGFVADSEDVRQQKKYVEILSKPGVTDKFETSSFEDKAQFLLSVLNECGADKTPNTTLGSAYPYFKKSVDEALKNVAEPVAHQTCPEKCPTSRDKCAECLKKRLQALEALFYVDCPDEYYKRAKSAADNKPESMKCSLCGAPLTVGAKKCEYCDTPTASGGSENKPAISSTKSPEQTAYDIIYEMQQEMLEKIAEPEYIAANKALSKAAYVNVTTISDSKKDELFTNSINTMIQLLKVKMTVSDLHAMANIYNLSVGSYLRCLFEGDQNVKIAAVYRAEEKNRQENAARKAAHEQEMQQIRDSYERKRKSNQEYWARYQAARSAPQYCGGGGSGGGGTSSGRNCDNCRYYVLESGRCSYKGYSMNAGDYCGAFEFKR